MNAIDRYFLTGFNSASYFEKKKAAYLLYIILSALSFIAFVTLGQLYFNLGDIYLGANLLALVGTVLALFLFKLGKVDAAGHVMSCGIAIMILIEHVLRDLAYTDPAIRYRLYVTMVSVLGLFFVVISFFREKKFMLFYGTAFVVILFIHALIIDHQLKGIPDMSLFVWEHFITVSIGMTFIAAITNWLLSYTEALFQQNMEYTELFKSRQEQLEIVVEDRTVALKTSNKHLREFAYIVSHDLKEPLRTISGFVTLINKELTRMGLSEGEIREYIDYVKKGTTQMEKLINDILAYSKLNIVEQHQEEVEMAHVIAEVKEALGGAIKESNAQITVTETINVAGEKSLLEQLFQNIISNAIKYRSEERDLNIVIGCKEDKEMVEYFIQDNGIGIPEQHFDTIFKAFRRLHSKITHEGSGVGLAICKKIVDIHGGDLWVESEEGIGSIFRFTLPKPQDEMPAVQPVVHAA